MCRSYPASRDIFRLMDQEKLVRKKVMNVISSDDEINIYVIIIGFRIDNAHTHRLQRQTDRQRQTAVRFLLIYFKNIISTITQSLF